MEANDMAKMREACQKMRDLLMLRGDGMARCTLTWDEFNESQKMLRNALAAPARNCDVGTAEEQSRRFREYCGSRCLAKCRVYEKGIALGIVSKNDYYKTDCRFVWAQMPYNEEGGNDGNE